MPGPKPVVIVDTNIFIDALRKDIAVRERLTTIRIGLSPIVMGELYSGAFSSTRPLQQLNRLTALLGNTHLLPCNFGTTAAYGHIRHMLRQQGTPIPDNDIWIAASAIQYDLPVATRDSHFKHIAGLTIERW